MGTKASPDAPPSPLRATHAPPPPNRSTATRSPGPATSSIAPRRDTPKRLSELQYAIGVLSSCPNLVIYLDAGAADAEQPSRVARLLNRAGVARIQGFFLNSTHFDWTSKEIRFGERISRLTGGKHFVVNTGENGQGPIVPRDRVHKGNEVLCNPPNRGLGPRPPRTRATPASTPLPGRATPVSPAARACPERRRPAPTGLSTRSGRSGTRTSTRAEARRGGRAWSGAGSARRAAGRPRATAPRDTRHRIPGVLISTDCLLPSDSGQVSAAETLR